MQLVKEKWILSLEAVIAYLHCDLVQNPLDKQDTNFQSVGVTLMDEEKALNMDVNESVQEIEAAVKEAFVNWAKYYTADCVWNSWNCEKIRESGLRLEYLPLTPEVCFPLSRSILIQRSCMFFFTG